MQSTIIQYCPKKRKINKYYKKGEKESKSIKILSRKNKKQFYLNT